jgi:nucleotide-binding universal stress UspA family protein
MVPGGKGEKMFKRILAATDMLTDKDTPVLTAAKIAEQNNAKLYILHVLESASSENRQLIKHFRTGEDILTTTDYENSVKTHLYKMYKEMFQSSLHYEIRVAPGFPWEEILRWAREKHTDLIVLGPHSTRAEEKKVVRVVGKIGSTVEGVMMRENCPVMIVNPSILKTAAAFKKIVVGIDFSRSCECALCFAVEFARKYGSKLFPFHMLPVPPLPKYSKADYEADIESAKKNLKEFCQEFLEEIDHEYIVWGGALPHLEILKCVENKDADLIMMGSHTKEKNGKWYAGSVVERASYRANCPIITVTDPEVLLPWEDNLTAKIQAQKGRDRSIRVFSRTEKAKID